MKEVGYLVGVEFVKPEDYKGGKEDTTPIMCFRSLDDSLIFAQYEWNPRFYLIAKDDKDAEWFENYFATHDLIVKSRGKDKKIEFVRPPSTAVKSVKGNRPTVEFQLAKYSDKNAFINALKEMKPRPPIYGFYPSEKLSYPELFYLFNDLRCQDQYILDLEETDKITPDNSVIFDIKKMRRTGEKNTKIKVLSYDEETSLRNLNGIKAGDTVSVSFSHKDFELAITYKPPNYKGSALDFYYQIKSSEDPEFDIVVENNKNDMWKYVSDVYSSADFDFSVGYNKQGYDNVQMYNQSDFPIIGKGGYKVSWKPVTDVGVAMRGGFIQDLDLLRDANKLRFFPLQLSRKKLKDIETLFGVNRPDYFKSKESGEALASISNVMEMLKHNWYDVRNTREIFERYWRGEYEPL